MSSLTLAGATGAMLGKAEIAKTGDAYDIYFPNRQFVLFDKVPVSEQRLRGWFERLLKCWPTKEQIDAGYPVPKRNKRCTNPPDVGFLLTGEVNEGEGFVIFWDDGWIKGCANDCLLPVAFDQTLDDAVALRDEIEAVLHTATSTQ